MAYDNIAWSLYLVCKRQTPANLGMLGTCFPLNTPRHFLTAAHCIRSVPLSELVVQGTGLLSKRAQVTRVAIHPTADVAVLEIDLPSEHYIAPLQLGKLGNFYWGAPVVAFGFPADTTYLGTPKDYITMTGPTARFFRGHVQRTGLHISHDGFKYQAMELSFAAPAGLSGGPVFIADSEDPIALVAENQESSTYLHTITEVRDEGKEFHESIHSVVNYAISVSLVNLGEWIAGETSDA